MHIEALDFAHGDRNRDLQFERAAAFPQQASGEILVALLVALSSRESCDPVQNRASCLSA